MNKVNPFMSSTIIDLLQHRIQQEEQSSRTYLAMSMRAEDKWFLGAAKLMSKYSKEELIHADKAKEMLLMHWIQPKTPALGVPKESFSSLPEIIHDGYAHEVEITKQCQALTKAAFDEGNFMVMELGLRYSKEQAEELGKFQNLLDRLEAFGDTPELLRELDKEMQELAE